MKNISENRIRLATGSGPNKQAQSTGGTDHRDREINVIKNPQSSKTKPERELVKKGFGKRHR